MGSDIYGGAIGVGAVTLGLPPCGSWRCDFTVVLMSATVILLTVSPSAMAAVGVGGERRWGASVGDGSATLSADL